MDFKLDERHLMLQQAVRRFAKKEVAPQAQSIERDHLFPTELYQQVAKLGWLCTAIPAQYGGGGLDLMGDYIVAEELATQLPGFAMDCMVHSGVIAYKVLWKMGTEDQRQRYLPPACRGEFIGAIVMTEPDAGSDLRGIKTTAVPDGDDFILNGTKTFITNFGAPLPSVGVVLTKLQNGDKPTFAAFLVEKEMTGVSVSPPIEMCGMKSSSQNEISFDNVRVPRTNLIGNEGDGLRVVLSATDVDRILCCSLSTGIARGAYQLALAYAQKRRAFGQPIAQFQAVQMMLARMAMDIRAAKLLGYYAAQREAANVPCSADTAMAKLFATTMAQQVTEHAMHIYGGHGYAVESGVERFYRDNIAVVLGGGATEILHMVVARGTLGGGLDESLDL